MFSPAGEIIVLRVGGELDLFTFPVLQAALDGSLGRQPEHLIVDLSRLSFCSVRGLSLLTETASTAAAQGTGYAVSGMPARLDCIWETYWKAEVPTRYRSVAVAVTDIRARQATEPE